MKALDKRQIEFIESACHYLEQPGFLIGLTNFVGKPLEFILSKLPASAETVIHQASEKALWSAAKGALLTVNEKSTALSFDEGLEVSLARRIQHNTVAALSGGMGGFLGGLALAVELPLTTAVMMRSIATIARSHGKDLSQPSLVPEMISIFAYGGPTGKDAAMNSSYYLERIALEELVREASAYLAIRTMEDVADAIAKGTAPRLVRLVLAIAERFEVAVSEKLMAQSLPIIGAIGGATINTLFANHFGHVANYHFGLQRLERECGEAVVRSVYEQSLRLLTEPERTRAAEG